MPDEESKGCGEGKESNEFEIGVEHSEVYTFLSLKLSESVKIKGTTQSLWRGAKINVHHVDCYIRV
jgi:hypothetical protein